MPVSIDHLIPHRPPMRWIDSLSESTETTATVTTSFEASHFAVAEGGVLETALVECLAQAVAAGLGHQASLTQPSGPPRQGMLAAVSGFSIQSQPPLGKTLRIELRHLKRLGPMLLISGTITCQGQPVASGELTLHA